MGIKQTLQIGDRIIGRAHKAFVIAEVAQAHDGSLGIAHSYIDAAADAGADAIKFQTHIAQAESTKDEPFRVRMSGQDKTRYDYWRRMEFSPEEWAGLRDHAHTKGIVFLSSAFCVPAVELLARIGMPAWKIGSGEFRSSELMMAMKKAGGPILLSTGMSRYEEVAAAADWFVASGVSFGLFQCTSLYPSPLEKVGVNVIGEFKERFGGCPVGLSDHSASVFPSLMALAQGADMIEVHITFDRRMYGPDTKASLTVDEIAHICAARDAFHVMRTSPVNKDFLADEMAQMRDLFTKSVALAHDLAAGSVLSPEDLVPKKPGTGIPYAEKSALAGRVLACDVSCDRLLRWDDLIDDKEGGNA